MKHVYNEEYAGWQLRTEHAVMTIVKTELPLASQTYPITGGNLL